MIRYRLDELGWYQFEQLIQSILKAQFGFAIESWGGRGDWGIDAYFKGKLNYPSEKTPSEGLFIFQIKFIENANASGARPERALMKAVKAEINRLKNSRYSWIEEVDHYIFITNAPVSSKQKREIQTLFTNVFPDAKIHVHSGKDICDWLDNNPHIRKAFPQLLSLRDLKTLLEEIVNKQILERSQVVIEHAKEIVSVFVPTKAYKQAWNTLKEYHFVVLDGPPEVGKTVTALIIALVQISDGWEAIYCTEPREILQAYKPNSKQIFIADDAFGRTEYRPERGRMWERDLPIILRRINNRHWLILTSRKHILERAYKDMDLQDKASSFPKPAEVIVDATQLSIEEKALMLYRHAKAENLSNNAKNIVRKYAKQIVENPNFTPERIRRFVKERLCELSEQFSSGVIDESSLKYEINEAINNPTDRMRKTYDKLPPSHKWLLASLLAIDKGHGVSLVELKKVYTQNCPSQEVSNFDDIVEELTESFIKKIKWPGTDKIQIEWIHPSYRDLLIEKLSKSNTMVNELLKKATIATIELAISDAGGESGERELPFLINKEQWDIFTKRFLEIVETEFMNDKIITRLLNVLFSSYSNTSKKDIKNNIAELSQKVLDKLRDLWNTNHKAVSPDTLKAFYQLSLISSVYVQSPNLMPSWDAALNEFKEGIALWEKNYLDYSKCNTWIDLLWVIKDNEPRFLQYISFPKNFEEIIDKFLEIAESELNFDLIDDDPDNLRSFADDCLNLWLFSNLVGLSKSIFDN